MAATWRSMQRQDVELRRERANLEHVSIAALEALVNALEAKDPYLRGHSARIADLSAMVAAESWAQRRGSGTDSRRRAAA